MTSYDRTTLWQRALGASITDSHEKERERLRSAYETARSRAQPLAEAIAKDLPEYTVHDITHSDALWEYADLIAGPVYALNPCEAFVLGCAFLVHDLGMGLAAYPGGIDELKELPRWKDTVAHLLNDRKAEAPTTEASDQSLDEIEKEALGEVLRHLHAERAETLALTYWTSSTGDRFYLIDDPDLRSSFGPIIGSVATSHWWPVDKIAIEMATQMGAPVGFPQGWTVDPLKLACLLRVADICHIDERRAPDFLNALRSIKTGSSEHWAFQRKLYQPRLEGDRLVYTAKSGFGLEEAGAWWLCFDTLKSIDLELRRVDALLADTNRDRLAARAVSQADVPSRLARLIRPDGWRPVDTRLRVSRVSDLVNKLGGSELYGSTSMPPLRELIQNGADAVCARRLMDDLSADWGEVRVSMGSDEQGTWIQVEDTGIGMSEEVLTQALLDFGTSFWGSRLMHEELPGLASRGFRATGRFGIGFFSVFMWGDAVEVVTQRYDCGREAALVLAFERGLTQRPILRKAQPLEYLRDGGTRVRVWLRDAAIFSDLLEESEKSNLAGVCSEVAPCLGVTLVVDEGGERERVVVADDWLDIASEELMARISRARSRRRARATAKGMRDYRGGTPALSYLCDESGRCYGRASIWGWRGYDGFSSNGAVTVGGLSGGRLSGIEGVLIGAPSRAARDQSVPIVPAGIRKEWVEKEREARLSEGHRPELLESIAEVVVALGVSPGGLPIARTDSGWVTAAEISSIATDLTEVVLIDRYMVENATGRAAEAAFARGVFCTTGHPSSILVSSAGASWLEWPEFDDQDMDEWGEQWYLARTLEGSVISALASAWGCTLRELIEASMFPEWESPVEKLVGTLTSEPYVEEVSAICRRPGAV